MNRGAFHQSLWSLDNMMRPLTHPLLSSSSSSSTTTSSSPSSSFFIPPHYFSQPSNNLELMMSPANWLDNQGLPESWSQLLMGGSIEELEDRCSFTPFQTKKMENWEEQTTGPSPSAATHINNVDHVKMELCDKGYIYRHASHEELMKAPMPPLWSQIVMPSSSPRSCITTCLNSNMLDFSINGKKETRHHHQLDQSSQECNSTTTGAPHKKARVQASSAQSTFKVRKEKLGDRIAALHQLVSPFGKTDTASVLLEAIGYIRFLQSQIEALSSPYLAAAGDSANMINRQQPAALAQGDQKSSIFPEDPGQLLNDNGTKRRGSSDQDGADQEPKDDLRSRGLCLVPVSFTMHVGNDNGADYWAPTFAGGFR